MTRTALRTLTLFAGMILWSGAISGQVMTGTPAFGSFGGGPFDTINLGNLNAHFVVPVFQRGGRGIPLQYNLTYESSIWSPVSVNGVQTWQASNNYGWAGTTDIGTPAQGSLTSKTTAMPGCNPFGIMVYWTYIDTLGNRHQFPDATVAGSGNCPTTSINEVAPDGSGYYLSATGTSGKVTWRTGTLWSGSTIKDTNGNQITMSGNQVFDTLSSTAAALTVSGSPISPPVTYAYPNPQTGNTSNVVVTYHIYTVQTNFGCSGISEVTQANTPLVDQIQLPDGSFYAFTYEATVGSSSNVTGRINSVTLPTGGMITYQYSGGSGGPNHNAIVCADGSVATLTRTLNPGSTWTYTRTQISGNHWQTKVTTPPDPSVGNDTVIDFQRDGATRSTNNFYETQRLAYQGSVNGTLLSTTNICYNGNGITTPSTCPTVAVASPILRVTAFNYLPNSSGVKAETDSTFDNFGLIHDVYTYDYPNATTLLKHTATTYQGGMSNGIVDRPYQVTTYQGSTLQAQTTYTYDEGTPQTKDGTPQHVSVTGSRGNLTTIAARANTGGTTLYRHFTYYDTGLLNTSTDVSTSSTTNGATTTYNYAPGTSSCNNSFVTSISEPLNLSLSMQWNCDGGAPFSVTDENNQTTSVDYGADPYWRATSSVDPLNVETIYSYQPNPPMAGSSVSFSNSVVGAFSYGDGFGRIITTQQPQAPGSSTLDTASYVYDSLGRLSSSSMPCAASAGQTCPAPPQIPYTTQTYDALGRPVLTTDGGGETVTYSYTKNDVYVTVGPAPSGEQTKRKQYEYDALGRLSSVCEITTASGSGSCGQSSPQTGYWTRYTYNSVGNLTQVIQNYQGSSQTRTYAYDLLGRMTSESNPETAGIAVSYAYDTDSVCTGGYPAGNQIKRTDANGNVACTTYDQLHRPLTTTYPSGQNSGNTDTKNYVYDSATVNGVTMLNTKGRLAEAYTCSHTGSCSPPKTDIGLSYSVRGELTDTYSLTPHSGGYGHVVQTYWPHGAVNSVAVPGLPTLYYGASNGTGLDGEGRVTQVTASSGQNPVAGVTYTMSGTTQPIGSLTQVTFGSGDSDNFSFDTNTGRPQLFRGTMGLLSNTGSLTWNPNGSLGALSIVDQINPTNSQNCSFSHDDLGRVASANCGSLWNQSFNFDPFGNITKTGSISWGCATCYNSTTNRYNSTLSPLISYDSNGNLLNDTFHTYTWDADARMLTADSTPITYDAFDRMAELNNSTQFLYLANGQQPVALKSGSTTTGYAPLPGGGFAIYSGGTITQYNHSDWLGSARLITSTSQTVVIDRSYAPYGEPYGPSGSSWLQFTNAGNQWTASGNADFLYRRYSTTQGRWLSPDPAGLAAVDLTNPQTWNRYAYVGNRPLGATDPLGLDDQGCYEDWNCDPCFLWVDCGYNPFGGPPGSSTPPPPPTPDQFPRVGGEWPDNESLGLPSGMKLRPLGLADLLGITPNLHCPVCMDIITGVSAGGTDGADYTFYVDALGRALEATNGGATISAAPAQPWYKNRCVMSALGSGGASVLLDAIGLLPEGKAFTGVYSLFHGAAGASNGLNILKRVKAGVGIITTTGALNEDDAIGIGLGVAGFVPGLGQAAAGFSIAHDFYNTAKAVGKCY